MDADGDGYGEGADCRGPDCDDDWAGIHDGCGPDCAGVPTTEGCPCESVDAEACYGGPDGTAGVGACTAGVRVCRGGAWSACEGERLPQLEQCDYADDDCDGVVDDGVSNACGACGGSCDRLCAGAGCVFPFAAGVGARVEDDGALAAAPARAPPGDLWVLVGARGVLRVDAAGRALMARYLLGPDPILPRAVAVDGAGDAYVLAGTVGGERPVAVVAVRATGCPDRNGDGVVSTSVGDAALPYGADECVLWRTEPEACDSDCSGAGGLAIASDGARVWVALEDSGQVVELDTATGAPTGRTFVLETPGPLLDDGAGHLWASSAGESLVRMELSDPDPASIRAEAIVVGPALGAIELGDDGALFTATPLSRVEPDLSLVRSDVIARSLAVDGLGDLWSTDDTSSVRRSTGQLDLQDSYEVPGQATSITVDRAGDLWVTTVDPAALLVVDPEVGDVLASELAGCTACLGDRPLLAGDPAGLRLERAYGPVWSRGQGSALLVSNCRFHPNAVEVERRSGRVRVWLRGANNAGDLSAEPWTDVGTFPPDVRVPVGGVTAGSFHEVRLETLEPDTIVAHVTLTGGCS